jgi:hypothetical protein
VCKKAIPVGIDDALIGKLPVYTLSLFAHSFSSYVDPHFTGAVIKSFSDALQTSLAFKTKLVKHPLSLESGG